jgi:hypothetical protein
VQDAWLIRIQVNNITAPELRLEGPQLAVENRVVWGYTEAPISITAAS